MSDMDTKPPVERELSEAQIQDLGSRGLEEYIGHKQRVFAEAMSDYDIVGAKYDPVHGSFIVVTDRGAAGGGAFGMLGSGDEEGYQLSTGPRKAEVPFAGSPGFKEMGYTSPSPFTSWTREEWNPKLRDKLGLREYYKMKRQDGIVRGALRLLKTPIQAGRWFVEPGSQSTRDKNIADFVSKNLFEWLNVSWSTLLGDILLMCEYGYIAFEKVYKRNDQGQIILQKLAPRHPLDIREWRYDDEGGPDGLVMEPTQMTGYDKPETFIPISKLAVFSMEPEAGDLSGISVLRSAYKHYYYKDTLYKIDAIQKERHGIGVPVIKLPPGFSPADRALADQLGRNLRTNERAHIVLPPNWELIFAILEGQPVSCIESINHHNMQIMANILAPFLEDSSVDPKSTDMFLKSTRYIGASVIDIFNKFILPELVDINFTMGPRRSYPRLNVRRVGEQEDLRTMSFTFRNLVGAGAIIPDDELEAFMRRELDLPPRDPTTARVVPGAPGDPNLEADQEADQDHSKNSRDEDTRPKSRGNFDPEPPRPGRTGGTRQSNVPSTTPGRTNTGMDKSGRSGR